MVCLIVEAPDDAAARLLMARAAYAAGAEDQVREHAEALPEGTPEQREGRRLVDALVFREACGEGTGSGLGHHRPTENRAGFRS